VGERLFLYNEPMMQALLSQNMTGVEDFSSPPFLAYRFPHDPKTEPWTGKKWYNVLLDNFSILDDWTVTTSFPLFDAPSGSIDAVAPEEVFLVCTVRDRKRLGDSTYGARANVFSPLTHPFHVRARIYKPEFKIQEVWAEDLHPVPDPPPTNPDDFSAEATFYLTLGSTGVGAVRLSSYNTGFFRDDRDRAKRWARGRVRQMCEPTVSYVLRCPGVLPYIRVGDTVVLNQRLLRKANVVSVTWLLDPRKETVVEVSTWGGN
jgi:hypothetical protein